MLRFQKNDTTELKEFLYYSHVHDSKIKAITYNQSENELKIEAFNPIFSIMTAFSFYDIEIVLTIRGNDPGSRETIISLTAEEDCSYLKNYMHTCKNHSEDSLYLLFQMFSGDELHIVAREVAIETIG